MKISYVLALAAALAVGSARPASSPLNPSELTDQAALYLSASCQKGLMEKVGRQMLTAGQRGVLGTSAPPSASTIQAVGMAPVASAQLFYMANDSISRTLHQQIAGHMMRYDPKQAPRIQSLMLSGVIWRDYDALLNRLGYSGRNVADVLTSYYIGSWEIVNQSVVTPDRWRAVRNQIARSLSRSPEIMLMSDIEKQRSSETLGIVTAVTNANRQALTIQGDQIGLLALQSSVYESLMAQGIDLKRLFVTARGFALR